jgi:Fe-S cluster assembly ATP-binding protein
MTSMLTIKGLRAAVDGHEILRGVDLDVRAGEIHALMGPNGSGKSTLSHTLMGRADYEVLGGSASIDGVELLGRPTYERARAGLFVAMQYPVAVPGVTLAELVGAAARGTGIDDTDAVARIAAEAADVGVRPSLLERGINDEFSGGEAKRAETVQLATLRPKFAVLDEIDSGLDVDALRAVARRVTRQVREDGLGVLAITHYARLLAELPPDRVHVFMAGRIVATGGPELADELEAVGYEGLAERLGVEELRVAAPVVDDPFGDRPQTKSLAELLDL